MYSPVKSLSKADKIAAVKQQKKQQLAVLLVNKFRNKFNVMTTTELDIDRHIVQEVQRLLEGGSTQQLALQKLDQQLAAEIKQMRANPRNNDKKSGVASKPTERHENPEETMMGRISAPVEDARSNRSHGSVARSNNVRSQTVGASPIYKPTIAKPNPFNEGQQMMFEDPSAALNLSEDKWNEIVQENARKYEAGKREAKARALEKAKKFQEDQLKQASIKQQILAKQKEDERAEFNRIGLKASDIYYVNEDRKAAANAALKGGAREVAEKLRQDHMHQLDEKQKLMRQEAVARREQLEKLKAEDLAEKERRAAKKQQLRAIQDADYAAKHEFKNRNSKLQTGVADFGDHNVLSYVYTNKEHKSYKLRQRNEHLIGLMADQFQVQDR